MCPRDIHAASIEINTRNAIFKPYKTVDCHLHSSKTSLSAQTLPSAENSITISTHANHSLRVFVSLSLSLFPFFFFRFSPRKFVDHFHFDRCRAINPIAQPQFVRYVEKFCLVSIAYQTLSPPLVLDWRIDICIYILRQRIYQVTCQFVDRLLFFPFSFSFFFIQFL